MILDDSRWKGQIYVGGAWVPGAGGVADVIEPATGAALAQSGVAGPADVATAAVSASEAQREWAALPHPARERSIGQIPHRAPQDSDKLEKTMGKSPSALVPSSRRAFAVTAHGMPVARRSSAR